MLILIGILGAAFGSFAGAQVWRLRARQLVEDKKAGEKVSAKELKKLSPLLKKTSKDRSRCLSCGHILAWYDLIPLVSWLLLRGKCRYCKKFIGWTEFFLEVGMAALFALSVFLWPMPLASFWQIMMLALWLAALVLLAIVLGTLGKVDVVWSLSDMFNGFMVIPNLIALFLLRKEIRAVYDDYLAQKKAGGALSYHYEFHEYHEQQ